MGVRKVGIPILGLLILLATSCGESETPASAQASVAPTAPAAVPLATVVPSPTAPAVQPTPTPTLPTGTPAPPTPTPTLPTGTPAPPTPTPTLPAGTPAPPTPTPTLPAGTPAPPTPTPTLPTAPPAPPTLTPTPAPVPAKPTTGVGQTVSSTAKSGLQLTLFLPQTTYSLADAIEARLTLLTTTGEDVTITTATAQLFDLSIPYPRKGQQQRWSQDRMFAQVVSSHKIGAQGGLSRVLVWRSLSESAGDITLVGLTVPLVLQGKRVQLQTLPITVVVR